MLREWFANGVPTEHQRDEVFVKLMVGLASGEADPARLIQTQRAHLYQELHAATTQRDEYDPQTELAQIMLTDKTIMHLEADLRWLDMIEMRLEAIKGQPFPEPRSGAGAGRAKVRPARNTHRLSGRLRHLINLIYKTPNRFFRPEQNVV